MTYWYGVKTTYNSHYTQSFTDFSLQSKEHREELGQLSKKNMSRR